MVSVSVSSVVDAPAATVWRRVSTFDGINHELMPVMRMVPPRRYRGTTIDNVPVGVPLGRIPVWYLGFLPIDYDAMTLVEIVPGSHFHEQSTMRTMRRWEHRRVLVQFDDGQRTQVTDTLTFEPRFPLNTPTATWFVRRLFAHRHRRLRTFFQN